MAAPKPRLGGWVRELRHNRATSALGKDLGSRWLERGGMGGEGDWGIGAGARRSGETQAAGGAPGDPRLSQTRSPPAPQPSPWKAVGREWPVPADWAHGRGQGPSYLGGVQLPRVPAPRAQQDGRSSANGEAPRPARPPRGPRTGISVPARPPPRLDGARAAIGAALRPARLPWRRAFVWPRRGRSAREQRPRPQREAGGARAGE